MRLLSLFALIVLFLASCSSGENKNPEYLPKATGKPGDVLVIIDSILWNGEVGKELRKTLLADFPGLPQGEPMFNVIHIHPTKSLTMLKQMRNLIYVFTLEQQTSGSKTMRREFTEETLNRIRTDTTFRISTRKDEYAKGQEVMYLFNETNAGLVEFLKDQRENITNYFNRTERERLSAELFRTRTTQGVTDFLRAEQKVELRVPIGYRLAEKTDDFIWLRSMTAETDKDIFIAWKPYESEYQLLPDSVITWRGEIAKRYLYEDPARPETFIVTELENAKVRARQTQLNGQFSMELRGLWRTNTYSMGGPFLGYALVDEPRGRLYYIEGFVYAPGRDKREMMRELEIILSTFKTSGNLSK